MKVPALSGVCHTVPFRFEDGTTYFNRAVTIDVGLTNIQFSILHQKNVFILSPLKTWDHC